MPAVGGGPDRRHAGPGRAGQAGGTLAIGLLGTLELRVDDEPVEIGARKQRSLLGLLALRTGAIVGRDEIIDVLWGDDPPATCVGLVHSYASRLRAALRAAGAGMPEAISATRQGYRLDAGQVRSDVDAFDELVARAGPGSDSRTAFSALTEALRLWRGPVLADAVPSLTRHPAAVTLARRRAAAVLAYTDAAIELGHLEQAAEQVRVQLRDEPMHEGLHARLMLALALSGRQADALRHYGEVRERLAEELGVDPGPELQGAHLKVLRNELRPAAPARVTSRTVPAQLPRDTAGFVGRQRQSHQLGRLAGSGARPPAAGAGPASSGLVQVTGMPGVGKTSFVVHWAHTVSSRFPDGQLYADLRGHSTGSPSEPLDVLRLFLDTLGLPPERAPRTTSEGVALYRTMMADRRMLVVLDDVATAQQVRPLLAGGAGSLQVVTSRNRLAGLVARDGAQVVELDVLTKCESRDLLAQVLGTARAAAEPKAIDDIIESCAHLPLALSVAASHLAIRPSVPVRTFAEELRGSDRLGLLRAQEDEHAAVRPAFDLSYAALDAEERTLFRRLALAPLPEIDRAGAAALADTDLRLAGLLLERLASRHLIEPHGAGSYHVHELLRLYAAERGQEDSATERRSARERLQRVVRPAGRAGDRSAATA